MKYYDVDNIIGVCVTLALKWKRAIRHCKVIDYLSQNRAKEEIESR